MAYWLFKTEPDVFGITDLVAAPKHTARWDEIRNYQARNFLRDHIKNGDDVFIYHSQCKPTAIVGTAKVASNSYPDPAQYDDTSKYFDPKATYNTPRWFCVDIQHKNTFKNPIPLSLIKTIPKLANMVLLKQGRLSIQPVSDNEAKILLDLI